MPLSPSPDDIARHLVLKTPIGPPFPAGSASLVVGMGCFWGAERLFWRQPGVVVTAVGYGGGAGADPDYRMVCAGDSGHAELVLVVFDPQALPLDAVLRLFWENHDPTQGMRQGNDIGSQYRSVIQAADDAQMAGALASRDRYGARLAAAGLGPITTEIGPRQPFYYAEPYHQQYLARNPDGYCGLRGTGILLG